MSDPVAGFIEAACVPLDAWHASGTLKRAVAILAAHPEVARSGIHAAAILGDGEAVERFVAADPASATATGGPRGWDALTHLCFSRYLRLDRARSDGFVRAARALLDAGADANTGWFENAHSPNPEWESALYGAAGVAHHPGVTRLLLERGADPNTGEVAYHAGEGFDNESMAILVESRRLTADTLATLLLRKLDWTDYDGVAWLLSRGVDPNYLSFWGDRGLHHSLARDNAPRFVELLLDHGADPTLPRKDGMTSVALAARMGRADALESFARRGFPITLQGDDAFLAAAARADEPAAAAMLAADPELAARLRAEDPGVLVRFAGAGNTEGVRFLLDLGFDAAAASDRHGGQTALHVAAWRGRTDTVRLLAGRGAPLEAVDRHGRTPLSLAVRALVEWSEWTPHRTTDIVAALLDAGARPGSVRPFPSGSDEADALLRQHGRADA